MFDKIKYDIDKNKQKKLCKKNFHKPDYTSWIDHGRLYSYCTSCALKIYKVDNDVWRACDE